MGGPRARLQGTIGDATEIRARILSDTERAGMARMPRWQAVDARGGRRPGPTGVELAGAIVRLAQAIVRDFRHIDSSTARVILIEAGSRLLPAFPEDLSASAKGSSRG